MYNFGLHRVINQEGVFPQTALKLDTSLPIHATELLVSVESLNIDSNSYRQIRQSCNSDTELMKSRILEIIGARGKMHNPETNSGGMLIGRVKEIGSKNKFNLAVNDSIATLVSLTLTPLYLNKILGLNPQDSRIKVDGYGIAFNSGIVTKLPNDLDQNIVLSVLDVCGAAKLTEKHSNPTDNLLILGGGSSGILSAFSAYDKGCRKITVLEKSLTRFNLLNSFQLPFRVIRGDAKDFVQMIDLFGSQQFDLTLDCLNVPDAEMSSIVLTKPAGRIIYFNTATNFTQAVLGAEGIGCQVELIMGNGYSPGHAEFSIDLLRKYKILQKLIHE